MPQVIPVWLALPITTSNYIIEWGRPTLMWMPCQGCPGPCACLKPQAPNTESLQQQYKPCREATLKGPASPTEAYSCDLHVMDLVKDGPQVTCMTAKDCTTGPAGRPHPWSGDSKNARQDLGPVPIQANWFTWALAAPLGMQQSQAEAGHPVQKSSTKRVPGSIVSVGIASHTQGDHSGRMPIWDQPLRP